MDIGKWYYNIYFDREESVEGYKTLLTTFKHKGKTQYLYLENSTQSNLLSIDIFPRDLEDIYTESRLFHGKVTNHKGFIFDYIFNNRDILMELL